jgi:hypothetical protein
MTQCKYPHRLLGIIFLKSYCCDCLQQRSEKYTASQLAVNLLLLDFKTNLASRNDRMNV